MGKIAPIEFSLQMSGDDDLYVRLGDCGQANELQPNLYIGEYIHVCTCLYVLFILYAL